VAHSTARILYATSSRSQIDDLNNTTVSNTPFVIIGRSSALNDEPATHVGVLWSGYWRNFVDLETAMRISLIPHREVAASADRSYDIAERKYGST